MRGRIIPDHGDLAQLARNQEAELRPLLLRVHVRNFIESRRRDAATLASFETIALGLFPLVPDDALADVASLLRGRSDIPASVRDAIAARLGQEKPAGIVPECEADLPRAVTVISDLDLARDPSCALGGDVLADLVGRAVRDRSLAQILLSRPEPSIFDRAALYRHADALTRMSIRHDLAAALASLHFPPATGASEAAEGLLVVAADSGFRGLSAELCHRLGIDAEPLAVDHPAGRELVLFALMAAGLDEAECIRVFLTLGGAPARSVTTVFELAKLARTTSRPVAAYLVGHEKVSAGRRRSVEASPLRGGANLLAGRRGESTARRAPPTERDQARNARLDRRS